MAVIDNSKWVVYMHRADENVFYVGHGRFSRAYMRHGRNKSWRKFVEKLSWKYEVAIVADFVRREEARACEKELIKKHRPPCNLHFEGMTRPGYTKGHKRYW